MSRALTKLAAIQKHLVNGFQLPAEFSAFVSLVTSAESPRDDALRVDWADPSQLLNIDEAASASDLLHFVTLADGGGVAFWKDGEHQRIVQYDSEGGYAVIALDFRDFLARVGKPTKAFRERIELDVDLDTSTLIPPTKPESVPAALNRKFKAWIEAHSLSAPILKSAESEELRKKLAALAGRVVADGLCKGYTPSSVLWTVKVLVVKHGEGWRASYLNYGKWPDLPTHYGFLELLPAVLPLMKSRKERYSFDIWKTGEVFVDGGNELALLSDDSLMD